MKKLLLIGILCATYTLVANVSNQVTLKTSTSSSKPMFFVYDGNMVTLNPGETKEVIAEEIRIGTTDPRSPAIAECHFGSERLVKACFPG